MDGKGKLSQDEKGRVKSHLLDSKTLKCQDCSTPMTLDVVDQVLTMRCAEENIQREVLFVVVKCSNCKSARLYPAKEIGINTDVIKS